MPAILPLTNELLDEAAYQTLPIVMVAFGKYRSAAGSGHKGMLGVADILRKAFCFRRVWFFIIRF